jgi:hypothetical protein
VTFHFQIYANSSSRVLPVLFGLGQNSNCRYWATGYSSFRESLVLTMPISLERNVVFQKSFVTRRTKCHKFQEAASGNLQPKDIVSVSAD